MSQMTAPSRIPRTTGRRPAPAPSLRVVPGARGARAGSGSAAFAVACIVLLAAGLMSLLLINISMSRASYALHDLQATSGELADTQDALTQQLSGLESPPHLAKRAVAMGMVPAPNAAFLRLSDGKVVGVAKKATKGEGFTVVSQTSSSPSPSSPAAPAAAVSGAPDGAAAPSTTDQSPGAAGTTEPSTTR
jgi:hypothetical protein